MNPHQQRLVDDLGAKIAQTSSLIRSSKHDDLSRNPEELIYSHLASLRTAIARVSGLNSVYDKQAESAQNQENYIGRNLRKIYGIAQCLLTDAQNGMLQHISELLHAESFADFVDMAEHLLSEGYKDASAVICGSALELHIRNLARKGGIPVENADGKPLKSDRINADLASNSVYSKLDQKNVTAWLDLRNKAAHGQYSEYSKEQVQLLCSAVKDFATRNPA